MSTAGRGHMQIHTNSRSQCMLCIFTILFTVSKIFLLFIFILPDSLKIHLPEEINFFLYMWFLL